MADTDLEAGDKTLFLNKGGVNVEDLSDADGGRLAHIGILVLQALAEWLAEVFGDLVDTDAAHGAYRECADQRVGVFAVLRHQSRLIEQRTGCQKKHIKNT